MTKYAFVAVALPLSAIACTTEEPLPIECDDPAPQVTCGAGTRLSGLECVVDNQRRFELRVKSREISADRLNPVPILALGTNADGTLVNEPAILSIDRAGAGAFPRPRIELGEMGALAHYRPCSSTQPGCLGPARFSMALVSDPSTVVATLDVNLVDEIGGSSAGACQTADRIMFFDGEDEVYAGTLAVTDAGWGVNGAPDRLRVRVEPNEMSQGRWWRLEFDTERLGTPLVPGVYENARRNNGNGNGNGNMRPGMEIEGLGRRCNGELGGRFEVHSYELVDDEVQSALISFEQRCAGAARSLRGCVRIGL